MTTPPTRSEAEIDSPAEESTPCPAHHGAVDEHIAHCIAGSGHDGPHVAVDEKGDIAALWD